MRKHPQSKYPLVSIIIGNFNEPDYTLECLDSLAKQSYPNIEIIVVDNGSTDNSVRKIKKFSGIKNFTLIRNNQNLGFAVPNNQGFEKSKGEYIFLLNNDAYIKKDTIVKVVKYMQENPKVGIVQNTILLVENPKFTDSTGSFLTRTGFLVHEGHKEPLTKNKRPKEVFSVKGASMFIRREAIEKAGFRSNEASASFIFDPDYFAYFEETDFCWRTILAGYKVMYLPDGITLHHLGKTARKQKAGSIQFHSFKNRLNSLLKNLSFGNLILTLPLHFLIVIFIAFAHLITLKFLSFFGILRAILWNFTHIGKTLRKRKGVQKRIRSVKDSYIFKKLAKPINLRWAINFTRLYLKS